ncbi:lactaldehyde reductase [Clostridia bacterium]|nr:lactaldehyde reductase [Clostridia bacterium]
MTKRMILNELAYFGKGAIREIVPFVASHNVHKALVVSDEVLVSLGVTKKVLDVLDGAGLSYEIFSKIKPNPTIQNVQDGVEAYKKADADYIIAVGGGSSMDTAKAIGIIINNPEFADIRSLEGEFRSKNRAVPLIAITTTAGTASEVTINYVITDEENKRKFVCVDANDLPLVAIVDPDMLASMPKSIAASTGLDALTHAIEGYITKNAWALPDALHLKAIEMIAQNLESAVAGNEEALENMGIAQYVAGMGFTNVGLGIVHSMAHTLGAFYDLPHGVANALLLPYVMEYNASATGEKYRDIAVAMGVKEAVDMTQEGYRIAAVNAVRSLSVNLDIPQKLHEVGVKQDDLQDLAESAYIDGNTAGNPKETSVDEIRSIFETAL